MTTAIRGVACNEKLPVGHLWRKLPKKHLREKLFYFRRSSAEEYIRLNDIMSNKSAKKKHFRQRKARAAAAQA